MTRFWTGIVNFPQRQIHKMYFKRGRRILVNVRFKLQTPDLHTRLLQASQFTCAGSTGHLMLFCYAHKMATQELHRLPTQLRTNTCKREHIAPLLGSGA
jgi:hypothetical protein